ncbi:MAG: protein kinase [Planctomycetes bacterium]|nr:protein kinase [Planctomycetota bacterium]
MRRRDELNPRNTEPDAVPGSGSAPGFLAGDSGSAAEEPTRVSDSRNTGAHVPAAADRPRIEGYELIEEVHRGGQGVVFRAHQLGTKRDVALKVLLEGAYASDMARRRFEREVELAASLKHPCIVTILDSGVSGGRMYFVMEFIEGQRLDQYLRRAQPPFDQVMRLFSQISDAVNFAHQRGVIHRDLKPSNMLVDRDGRPHLLDFGLAKMTRSTDPDETVADLSTAGQVIGTLAYMSPEQAAGSVDVDVRTDVYSLGVIFYEALLGRTPYPVSGPLGEVLHRIAHDDPARPRSLRLSTRFGRRIDDEIETILLKALEKEPVRRYQTAGDLARDLDRYLSSEPIEAKRASGLYMLRKTLRKYRWQAATAGVALLTILAFLVSLAVLYRSERRLRSEAETLRGLTAEKARELEQSLRKTEDAEKRASASLLEAEKNERDARLSAESLRRSLVRQKLQRGDLARVQGDLVEARDSYWDAYQDAPDDPAVLWQLRRYYFDSGDSGAIQLSLRTPHRMALSPNGATAAVAESSDSVTLRDAGSGLSTAWRPTPPDLQALTLDDHERLAASGPGWIRLWSPDGDAKDLAIPDNFNAERIALVADGAAVAAMRDALVRVCLVDRPEVDDVALYGVVRGTAAYEPQSRMLAIPTSAGVETLTFEPSGHVIEQQRCPMTGSGGARALAFATPNRIVAAGEAVELLQLGPDHSQPSTRILTSATRWDFVESARDGEMLALGTEDGRIGVYWNGAIEAEWQVTHNRLQAVRIDPATHNISTLVDRGTLTRWATRIYERIREQMLDRQAAKWALSADVGTLLMADSTGRVLLRQAGKGGRTSVVSLPSLMDIVTGRSPESLTLALSGDGALAVITIGDRIWLKSADRTRPLLVRWTVPATPKLSAVSLSHDGKLAAILSSSSAEDRQVISFHDTDSSGGRPEMRVGLPPVGQPYDVVGSVVRTLAFVPGGTYVVAARSNGDLLMLGPDTSASGGGPRQARNAARALWTKLDSPAYLLSFDGDGRKLAAACDDNTIRLLSVDDVSELGQINVERRVESIALHRDGGLLLVRLNDGMIEVYDTSTRERIAQWSGRGATGSAALVSWFGSDDSILISDPEGVFAVRHQAMDSVIAASRTFAAARAVSRKAVDGDWAGAWERTEALCKLDSKVGAELRLSLVEQVFRKLPTPPSDAWIELVEPDASFDGLLRLGHAAYRGGQFEHAARWLKRAATMENRRLDPDSELRLAECEYLLGDYGPALRRYAALAQQPQRSAADSSRLAVEWMAAMAAAGQFDDARQIARSFESLSGAADQSVLTRIAGAVIGEILAEQLGEARLSPTARALTTTVFAGPWSSYRDDVEFFLGENARRRDDMRAARDHYQRCLDLSRDEWPASWARFRLKQLEAAAP